MVVVIFTERNSGQEYLHLIQGAYDWRAIMDRNGFDVALLPVDWPLSSILKSDPSWQVVQDDTRVHTVSAAKSANPTELGRFDTHSASRVLKKT